MLVLNPSWPHFLGIFSFFLACFLGIFHWTLYGWADPTHCKALLNEGSWLDSKYKNWQPNGCILHTYSEKDASACLGHKEIVFIGDSITRKLFFEFAESLDSSLAKIPLEKTKKHSDHVLHTRYETGLKFAWDPFLNSTYTRWILGDALKEKLMKSKNPQRPAMVVMGSGLWYLRYANTSGGISAWEQTMDKVFTRLALDPMPADEVVILPVEHLATSKLTPVRADTMHPSDIEAMNSELYHRINPLTQSNAFQTRFKTLSDPSRVSLPLVFNKMVDPSLTDDGLHYYDSLLKVQARVLMNLRCNDVMPKTFPLNKTCCNRYPTPAWMHSIALLLVLLSGPIVVYFASKSGFRALPAILLSQEVLPAVIISVSIALIYLADRSNFWLKEQKQFDAWAFGILCFSSLIIGLLTVKRADKDLGFLNRDQTDEWKGWMQVAILIYHYYGASKVSGIYNPIRTLVASYLFMTGYGHATFYVRKSDFGFKRIAQVLIRLNLFTILLAYTMNTDYISYYFTPLVSMWYLIIYLTLFVGSSFNNQTPLLIGKIFLSAGLVTWFFKEETLLQSLFFFLERVCGIHWSAREWSFRVNLDIWIVYVGMLAAIAVIKFRDLRLTDHPRWPLVVRVSIALSILTMIWFFVFELLQESKFTYNKWHPYISFLPILAFIILRNSSVILRSASSRGFAFIGKCSLELFIVQYHFWLAGDTKGVLLVLSGTKWRPVNFIITTVMFVYLCDRISYAVGELTNRICGSEKEKGLPRPIVSVTPAPAPPSDTVFDAGSVDEEESEGQEVEIPMRMLDARKDAAGNPIPFEPDTPVRPRRWIDRLAEQTPPQTPGHPTLGSWIGRQRQQPLSLHVQLLLFLLVLWFFNIFWAYPPKVMPVT
ncbi:O-acetyltransferase [Crepidotus variabilis]|uniref:O-acetyltransferase n=1 Tax=Crepidotus variabilis TaxID=179855 RepID=A0A9P6JVG1_9AGAR|nr:O-acetyltransferase [Crepidotus variabilis]